MREALHLKRQKYNIWFINGGVHQKQRELKSTKVASLYLL